MTMRGLSILLVLAVSGVARAADGGSEPATGVPFQVRQGFYAETQLGVFTAFGGSKTFSNGAPFVALSTGFDVTSVPGLSAFLTVGHGSNLQSCHALTEKGDCQGWTLSDGSAAGGQGIESFSVMPIEVGARYAFGEVATRLKPYVAATAGFSIILPEMQKDSAIGSPHAGFGTGVEYATRLHGLTIGAEVLARATFMPVLLSITAYPRIKYVF